MNIFMVGSSADTALEQSYRRAMEAAGHEVFIYDVVDQFGEFTRFGRLGQIVNQYISVDPWRQKLNRDLSLRIRAGRPDLVLVFGNARILFSTLAFVKSVHDCRFVLVWPDPLTSLQPHVRDAALLYDGVATYCRASVALFERMGFANVQWVPLAADPALHENAAPASQFLYDLTFVGAWRPEREQALATLIRHFPALKMGIWGTSWSRSQSRTLKSHLHPKPLLGRQCAAMFGQSRLNLNVIDDACFPAANMRFFEIPVAHGLQLASACPEMAGTFKANEHILYFTDHDSLCTTVDYALSHPAEMVTIRQAGYDLVRQQHTYAHRTTQLLTRFL
ncbi:glycosyltransferase [Fibrella sp. HMF5335]|uniref:Glycosyltransferase n=1 Tax=Fibrella rubiginis TaxID=2817060 RepID=A0A939G9X1_9BACT|nr:glycosyltransferase [Fibrella rubiginis]MBO0934969.1 glycosyltransferase [Fibrella rubiginis]